MGKDWGVVREKLVKKVRQVEPAEIAKLLWLLLPLS